MATDNWDIACSTLNKNKISNTIINDDIRKMNFTDYSGCTDGLIGGPPCPPFSQTRHYLTKKQKSILYEEATESTDAYSGSQVQFEIGTWGSANGGLNLASESGQVANVTMFSPGSGYEVMPTITPASHRLTYDSSSLTSSGTFSAGETITNDASPAATAIITTFVRGNITISKATGAFAQGQVITGANSNAVATLTVVAALGASATFLGWSTTGIGSITGVEVSNFGTGFATAPTATVPV